MNCRQCGTEIADRALICFRCGTSVKEAVSKPYAPGATKRPLAVYVVVFAIIALIALLTAFFR